jgi:beta-glucosidase
LLQNKNNTLPISKAIGTLAVIGGLADDGDNQLGCWAPDGRSGDSITPLTSLK